MLFVLLKWSTKIPNLTLPKPKFMDTSMYIADLHKVGINDIEQVGGKNASLGEMLQNLTELGIQIPGGLVALTTLHN